MTSPAVRAEWKRRRHAESPFCHYCGRSLRLSDATVDHRVPLSRSGADVAKNWRIACRPCNRRKGSMPPEEWERRPPALPWDVGARKATLCAWGVVARAWRQGRRGAPWAWSVGDDGAGGLCGRTEAMRAAERVVRRRAPRT